MGMAVGTGMSVGVGSTVAVAVGCDVGVLAGIGVAVDWMDVVGTAVCPRLNGGCVGSTTSIGAQAAHNKTKKSGSKAIFFMLPL